VPKIIQIGKCLLKLQLKCHSVLTKCLTLSHYYYFIPGRHAKYCDQRVCLSAHISQKHFLQIFLYMLTVGAARSSSDSNAIRYVLPVLWMTSCFHIMDVIGPSQRRCICFIQFSRWRHQSDINVVWLKSPGGGTRCEVCRFRLHLVLQRDYSAT